MSKEFCHFNFVVFSDVGKFRATFLLKTVKELYCSTVDQSSNGTISHLATFIYFFLFYLSIVLDF